MSAGTLAERAVARAAKMSRLDVAALLLSSAHVAARLRELAEADRAEGDHWHASRMEALAAQLTAGQTAALEYRALEQWEQAVCLKLPDAAGKGGGRHVESSLHGSGPGEGDHRRGRRPDVGTADEQLPHPAAGG